MQQVFNVGEWPEFADGKLTPFMELMMIQETWTDFGGWYYNNDTYSIYYRITGHADAFLTPWLSLSSDTLEKAHIDDSMTQIFNTMSDRYAPGACAKCHSIARTEQGAKINWHATRPDPQSHSFTKFNHTKHFSLMSNKGSLTCHELNTSHDYPSSYNKNTDPSI